MTYVLCSLQKSENRFIRLEYNGRLKSYSFFSTDFWQGFYTDDEVDRVQVLVHHVVQEDAGEQVEGEKVQQRSFVVSPTPLVPNHGEQQEISHRLDKDPRDHGESIQDPIAFPLCLVKS